MKKPHKRTPRKPHPIYGAVVRTHVSLYESEKKELMKEYGGLTKALRSLLAKNKNQ